MQLKSTHTPPRNRPHHPLALRRATLCVTPILLLGLTVGCRTETPWVVPQDSLRNIQGIDLADPPPPPAPRSSTLVEPEQPANYPADLSLSLADVRQRVLANNLDLQVALIDPSIAELGVEEADAAFESVFTLDTNYFKGDQPSGTRLGDTGLPIANQNESISLTPGLRVPLRTGGFIGISAPVARQEFNSPTGENITYTSDLALSVSQPLLRGAGSDVAELRLKVAEIQQQRSEARARLEVTRALAEADRAYWRLAAARDALAVRVAGLRLAEAQLDRARRLERAGAAAGIESVRAEAGVADAQEAVLSAEIQLRLRQRDLKRLINDPELPVQSPTILLTTSEPAAMRIDVSVDLLIAHAHAERMELLETELQIVEQDFNQRAARNATLPLVNFEYTYNINGLGADLDDSFSVTADHDFIDHRIGLRVEIPLGNREARARYRASLLRRLQLLSTHEGRQQQIKKEVLDAHDQLQSAYQRIDAARTRVRVNERLVDAETRQFEQGLRTSTEVLEAQTRLIDAQNALVQAQADYQLSQIDLAYAAGMTLGRTNTTWQPRK